MALFEEGGVTGQLMPNETGNTGFDRIMTPCIVIVGIGCKRLVDIEKAETTEAIQDVICRFCLFRFDGEGMHERLICWCPKHRGPSEQATHGVIESLMPYGLKE